MNRNILIIEETSEYSTQYKRMFSLAHSLTVISSKEKFDKLLKDKKTRYDLAILEPMLNGENLISSFNIDELKNKLGCNNLFFVSKNNDIQFINTCLSQSIDYLTKPADYNEISFKLNRFLSTPPRLNPSTFTIANGEKESKRLTPIEKKVYEVFQKCTKQSYNNIKRNVWNGVNNHEEINLSVHISRLRQKLDTVDWEIEHFTSEKSYLLRPKYELFNPSN